MAAAKEDSVDIKELLDATDRALDGLTKSSIIELKAYVRPPKSVETVGKCVCILFNKEQKWENYRKLSGDKAFLKNLKMYDITSINPHMIKKLEKHFTHPDMTEKAVIRVSLPAGVLFKWCRAMYFFGKHSNKSFLLTASDSFFEEDEENK